MKLTQAGTVATRRAPSEWFTGPVWQDMLPEPPEPARVKVGFVRFDPGSRTFWHTHPLGQTLHVMSGTGLVQVWGQQARFIRPGDSVWFPPGEKHWHGAAATFGMTHLAVQEALEGSAATWMEQVSDEDYAAANAAAV